MNGTRSLYHTVATAVRIEHIPETDRVFLVFEIVDEQFKQKIKADWTQDIDLELKGKELVKYDVCP
jgi:hypothetical protein